MIYWMGEKPERCEMCGGEFEGSFVDGKTHLGPWALMCVGCHRTLGCGFGTGRGQKYKWNDEERKWVKVKGHGG